VFVDGGYGTLLHKRGLPAGLAPEIWSITRPDALVKAHADYLSAGADIITSNTFGVNAISYPGDGYTVEELVKAAAANIRKAELAAGKKALAALDIGPCGKLVGRDIGFEEAVSAFAATVRAGKDLFELAIIETFGDLAELRAAIIAVKENSDLPFIVTSVIGKDGRSFTGVPVEVFGAVAEEMGASAFGMNCSSGPDLMLELLPRITSAVRIPVCINPNAGMPGTLPDGSVVYDCSADAFASVMVKIAGEGARVLGGCCGTEPVYIEKMTSALAGAAPVKRKLPVARTRICSASSLYVFEEGRPAVIGERINPTGKKKFREALQNGDRDYALAEAYAQTANGADILDVNVGVPGIDESSVLCDTISSVQNVTGLPLQPDTSSPAAMEAALRIYNGIPLINSVNGSESSMSSILPLAAKYGGTVIALTLDEKGIPDSPEGRLEIAERIVGRAASYGIGINRIIVDPLTLTLGADPLAAEKTLSALRMIKNTLGVKTSLGVSNISFGLPNREEVNCGFLRAAIEAGLDAAIMNPASASMMKIARGEGADGQAADLSSFGIHKTDAAADLSTLHGCIIAGLASSSKAMAEKACAGQDPQSLIASEVIHALDIVGAGFEKGTVFLPGLLASAEAAVAALSVISAKIAENGAADAVRGKVVLATVEGDVHDIGKNIVGVMLRSYGFEVIDLGKNVPAEKVVSACTPDVKLVGLSALMTTTLPSMAKTVALLKEQRPGVKTVVGGAVLTAEYAAGIGADAYSPDATATVRFAEEVYK
ncbi:MAG: homocysteine S-methyltransferase family protein, partial [Clostridia bacterium]|nr:homocysteine S-methyltransferase family protein [Clostridia bacterium]